jgi:hypothetical protein
MMSTLRDPYFEESESESGRWAGLAGRRHQ